MAEGGSNGDDEHKKLMRRVRHLHLEDDNDRRVELQGQDEGDEERLDAIMRLAIDMDVEEEEKLRAQNNGQPETLEEGPYDSERLQAILRMAMEIDPEDDGAMQSQLGSHVSPQSLSVARRHDGVYCGEIRLSRRLCNLYEHVGRLKTLYCMNKLDADRIRYEEAKKVFDEKLQRFLTNPPPQQNLVSYLPEVVRQVRNKMHRAGRRYKSFGNYVDFLKYKRLMDLFIPLQRAYRNQNVQNANGKSSATQTQPSHTASQAQGSYITLPSQVPQAGELNVQELPQPSSYLPEDMRKLRNKIQYTRRNYRKHGKPETLAQLHSLSQLYFPQYHALKDQMGRGISQGSYEEPFPNVVIEDTPLNVQSTGLSTLQSGNQGAIPKQRQGQQPVVSNRSPTNLQPAINQSPFFNQAQVPSYAAPPPFNRRTTHPGYGQTQGQPMVPGATFTNSRVSLQKYVQSMQQGAPIPFHPAPGSGRPQQQCTKSMEMDFFVWLEYLSYLTHPNQQFGNTARYPQQPDQQHHQFYIQQEVWTQNAPLQQTYPATGRFLRGRVQQNYVLSDSSLRASDIQNVTRDGYGEWLNERQNQE